MCCELVRPAHGRSGSIEDAHEVGDEKYQMDQAVQHIGPFMVKLTTAASRVTSSSCASASPSPSSTVMSVTRLMPRTAGMVRPMVESADPRAMFMEIRTRADRTG